MDKKSFLDKLTFELKGIPWPEIQKQKDYYEEMLDDMLEDGMTEDQAVERLGDPAEIAREILREPGVKRVVLQPGGKTPRPAPRPQPEPKKKTEKAQKSPKATQDQKKTWNVVTLVLLILGAPLWVPLALAAIAVVLSVYLSLWSIALSFDVATLCLGVGGVISIIVGIVNIASSPAGAIAALGLGLLLLAVALLGVIIGDVMIVYLIKGTRWTFVKCKNWIRSIRRK